MSFAELSPYVIAAAIIGAMLVGYRLVTGSFAVWRVAIGADGRPSTSKLQAFLWTVVVMFAYLSIVVARAQQGVIAPVSNLPGNVLLAMGLSFATAIGATAITANQVSSGKIDKPPSDVGPQGLSAIFTNDAGRPDLGKLQLMAWTVVALGIFLAQTVREVHDITVSLTNVVPTIPDIDDALLVLTGLGQGAYLGGKLVTTTTARVTGTEPAQGPLQTRITIKGTGFGPSQSGNQVTLNGVPSVVIPDGWNDTEITFLFPVLQPNGSPWPPGASVNLGVLVDGRAGAGAGTFLLTA